MTYIESDADLIGLKYCCSSSNDFVVKLNILRSARLDQFELDEDFETLNIVKYNFE